MLQSTSNNHYIKIEIKQKYIEKIIFQITQLLLRIFSVDPLNL